MPDSGSAENQVPREIPDRNFPLFSHYEVRERLMKEMYTRAGRQRLGEVDTIIPAALRQKSFRKG